MRCVRRWPVRTPQRARLRSRCWYLLRIDTTGHISASLDRCRAGGKGLRGWEGGHRSCEMRGMMGKVSRSKAYPVCSSRPKTF